VRALLNCRVGERGIRRILRCNAFAHALLARRYSDALMLLDLVPDLAVPGYDGLDPIGACLLAPSLCEGDENKMVLNLRHLLRRASPHAYKLTRILFTCLSPDPMAKDLPQTWRLLFGTARDSAFREMVFDSWVKVTLRGAQSIASAETLKKLLDRVVSAQGISMPGIIGVFPPGFVHGERSLAPRALPLTLTTPAIHQARLDIAQRLNQPVVATPEGFNNLDLRGALLGACQPGQLKAGEWLASLGAVRPLGRDDFVSMLSRAASVPAYGGGDADLAEWALLLADSVGLRGQVLASSNILNLPWGPRAFTVAQVLVRHGASLVPPYASHRGQPSPNHRPLFLCYTRRRLDIREYLQVPDHVLLMPCSTVSCFDLSSTASEKTPMTSSTQPSSSPMATTAASSAPRQGLLFVRKHYDTR
jgi:hypothetical protein